MKTDVNGCSTTEFGKEQWEKFFSPTLKSTMLQYDYRTADGELFSCVAKTIEKARKKRDVWLAKNKSM